MKLRRLNPDEYHKVAFIFSEYGREVPSHEKMMIFVALSETDDIIGLVGFEQAPHMGPFWVSHDSRNKGVATRLIKFVESKLAKQPGGGYYIFPSTPAMKKACEKAGLVNTGWEIWKREF